jgi:hypothetical protein
MAVSGVTRVTLEYIVRKDGLVTKERLQEICLRQVLLFNVANKLKGWKLMGQYLNIPREKLRIIECEHVTEHQCMIVVLNLWYKREGKSATYWRLAEAFHQQEDLDLIQSLCTCLYEYDKESEKWSRHIDECFTPCACARGNDALGGALA